MPRQDLSNEQIRVYKEVSEWVGMHRMTARRLHLVEGAPLTSLYDFTIWFIKREVERRWRSDDLRAAHNERRLAKRRGNPKYLELSRKRNREKYYRDVDATRRMERERKKFYRATNVQAKLSKSLRGRLYELVRRKNAVKLDSALSLVGCSIAELKQHLESKFRRGMSWQNYGRVWHIDHILPCSKFDLTKLDEQRKCFSFLNLQPLFATENLAKGDSVSVAQIPMALAYEKN